MATAAARQDWRDAYDTQLEQLRWTRSDTGKMWLAAEAKLVSAEYSPLTRFLVETMYMMEPSRLEDATPYFVSPDMCQVVECAYPAFEPEPVFPTDVLTLSGFVYFAKPLTILDRFARPIRLTGFSWHPAMTNQDESLALRPFDPARVLTREDEFREYLEERHRQGFQDGLSIALYYSSESSAGVWPEELPRPPWLPMFCVPWWWGMSFEGNEVTELGRPSGASHWWKVVQTTLRLMQQRIAVHHVERPDRATRRYAKRLNLGERDVTVVTLRRERSQEHVEPQGEMHYSHRFMVGWPNGFWRNQWYRSARVHRQIFIAPYEKGPEGAPLIIKPRAYRWTR